MTRQDITIRWMQEFEKDLVVNAARKSFSLVFYVFLRIFYFSRKLRVVVVEQEGKIVGASAVSVYDLHPDKVGLIDFIFVIPEAAGQGLGSRLLESSQKYFSRQDAADFIAFVDGYNSPSWIMFNRQGFSWISLRQQLKLWGSKTFLLWFKSLYLKEIGHFMLWKSPEKEKPQVSWRPGEFFLMLAAISFFAWWGLRDYGINYSLLLLTMAVNIVIYEGAEWLTARVLGVSTEFRVWDNSITVNILLLIIPGLFIPAHGSIYLTDFEHNYKSRPEIKGKMAGAAVLTGFTFTLAIVMLHNIHQAELLSGVAIFSLIYYTFQAVLIFKPLQMFKGRQLRRWKPILWYLSVVSWLILVILFWF